MSEDSQSEARFESFLGALAASPAPYRPPTLGPGASFAERYTVERELGRGGMGAVYLAVDRKLGRKVALKVARGRVAEVELARLRQEATVMAGLSHPGIVTVFEAGVDGDDVYLALEFVPGGTLRDWLDAEPRPWRDVVTMFSAIARALAAAHAAGVVHRDFKPHNVLLDLRGRPRVADFGLARRPSEPPTLDLPVLSSASTLTVSGSVIGTPAYMSPEQAHGRDATPASDQFSFFVSLYEAVAGRRPFEGKSLQAVLDAIEAGPPSTVPNAPRTLAAVVRRGLHADPEQRHADMTVVAQALDHILHARRRRVRTATVSVALVAALGAGWMSRTQTDAPCLPEDLTDAVDGVWTAERRAGVLSTAGADAVAVLDAHRDALHDARVRACEAHRVAQTLSDTDFALRSSCIARLEGRLAGLGDDLATTPSPAASVEALLASPDTCEDIQALRRLYNRYDATSTRRDATEDTAYREATRLATLAARRSRRGEDTSETLGQLEPLADAHGFVALSAHAKLMRFSDSFDPHEKASLIRDAQRLATQSRDTQLLTEVAIQQAEFALAQRHLDAADAFIDNADVLVAFHADPKSQALDRMRITLTRQKIRLAQGHGADVAHTLATLLPTLPPESPEALEALMTRAEALADVGLLDDSVAAYDAMLRHPLAEDPSQRVGMTLNRAFILLSAARSDAADLALDGLVDMLGGLDACPPELQAYIIVGRAMAARLRDDLDQAETLVGRARALFEGVDAEHPEMGGVLDEQAAIAEARGNTDEALRLARAALRHHDATHGTDSLESALVLVRIARALHRSGDDERAAEHARRAADILRTQGRPADEQATAALALAAATGQPDEQARQACARSEQEICLQALR